MKTAEGDSWSDHWRQVWWMGRRYRRKRNKDCEGRQALWQWWHRACFSVSPEMLISYETKIYGKPLAWWIRHLLERRHIVEATAIGARVPQERFFQTFRTYPLKKGNNNTCRLQCGESCGNLLQRWKRSGISTVFLCNYYRVCYYKSGKKRLWNCCRSRNAVPESDSDIPYILKTEAAARMTADPCFEQERGEAQINTYESRM